jgi:hypothetical protein
VAQVDGEELAWLLDGDNAQSKTVLATNVQEAEVTML